MTIEEVKVNYGINSDGYISCYGCPVKEFCKRNLSGYEDCWEQFLKYANTLADISAETEPDNVKHPSHYETGKFECIDVMCEAIGIESVKGFCLCNAFKYIYRCKNKHDTPVEDVKKAVWYLNKFLELEGESDD